MKSIFFEIGFLSDLLLSVSQGKLDAAIHNGMK